MDAMNDDWRVLFELSGDERLAGALGRLREHALEDDVRDRLGDRVVVSHDGAHLYLYADSEATAREAERVVRPVLEERDYEAPAASFARWHPEEERWEHVSVPLPSTPEEHRAESARREADEVAESRAAGYPEWEVRLVLPDEAAARDFASTLARDDVPHVRRSRYVMVGAASEEAARRLGERLRAEAPPGTDFDVEGSGQEAWRVLNPFAVFGGLGA